MVNGTSLNYSFQSPLYLKSTSSLPSYLNSSKTNSSNSILPQENKTVTVDGEVYDVVKVNANDGKFTLVPEYKEVVIIDGQQYDVNEVSDPFVSDGTKEVVVIDGKEYDVNDGNSLNGILA